MSAASFDGLRVSSFDAYRPEKWSSNVFTRERLEVKQQLLLLARELEPTFERKDLRLQRYASDEYPSLRNGKKVDAQWVFFWRTEEERIVLEREVDLEKTLAATLADPTPMTRHAFICLRLDQDGLEMSFRLHNNAWVDSHNLLVKLSESRYRSEFFSLVTSLPEPLSASLYDDKVIRSQEFTEESIVEFVTEHIETREKDGFLRFGLSIDLNKIAQSGKELVDILAPNLAFVADIYHFVSWSEQNNFLQSDQEFLQRRARRDNRRQELEEKVLERKAAQEVKKKEQKAAREELEELFRREAASRTQETRKKRSSFLKDQQEKQTKVQQQTEEEQEFQKTVQNNEFQEQTKKDILEKRGQLEEFSQPLVKKKFHHDKKREIFARTPIPVLPVQKYEEQPVQTGHQAKVSKGPLAGQIGVVQEIDSRGTARVMVGLLATRVPVEDLIGLGPSLSSEDGAK